MGIFTGELMLTNKSNVAFALSNHFDNAFQMENSSKKCNTAEELRALANREHNYRKTWVVMEDNVNESILKYEDPIGNVYYLIAKKKDVDVSKFRGKIVDTLMWYSLADDQNSVEKARANAQVLYDLLKEIACN